MSSPHPLRGFREAHDPPLSQQELASLLGVKRETVNRWESGARKIDEEKLPLVAVKTGIAPAVLRPDLAERAKLFQQAAE
jgi:transcriptional regulator with XRE-family HTH domain